MAIQHAYVDLFLKNASHLPPSLHAHVTHFLGGSNLGTLCIVLGLWHESKSHKLFRIPGGLYVPGRSAVIDIHHWPRSHRLVSHGIFP